MKYKLTEETIEYRKRILYRIQALKDFANVKKGDLGGYIEKEFNLSQEGNCWVYNIAKIFGNVEIYNNARVYDRSEVFGNAEIYGNARIFGDTKISGNAEIYGNARIFGYAEISGNVRISGYAEIYDYVEQKNIEQKNRKKTISVSANKGKIMKIVMKILMKITNR